MFEKKVKVKTAVLISVIVAVGVFWLLQTFIGNEITAENSSKNLPVNNTQTCDYSIMRLNGYKFIKPLLFVEPLCESTKYGGLKYKISEVIKNLKTQASVTRASVYIKDFHKGEWMCINESELFFPSSLMKIPMMITYLLMEQKSPNLLNQKITFIRPPEIPHQTFNSNQIQEGKSYTIKELLKYMVVYSDNNATYLLNINANLDIFKKLFSDIGLAVPDIHDKNYAISSRNYSQFLRIIYSGNYLNVNNSEFAAELLSQCDFKDGMQKSIPEGVNIAHKFGEWGNSKGIHQLSESGIIYLDKNPYLLTVMTEGKDITVLSNLIADISKQCYDFMKVAD